MIDIFKDPGKNTTIVDLSDIISESDAKIFKSHPLLYPPKALQELYVLIKSTGGDMLACLSIYEDLQKMKRLGTNVVGITGTEASSGAFIILIGCTMRIVSQETKFRIHAINITRNIRRLNNELENIFVREIKKHKEDLLHMKDEELSTFVKESLWSASLNPIELQEKLEEIIRKHTLLSPERIAQIMSQKNITTIRPAEALELGIADKICD